MKIKNNIALAAAALGLMMGSCANHDILNEIVIPGQEVPTCYWEVGSTACPAGESFTFQGKYTVEYKGGTPSHSEVWYRINRAESAGASVALAGATFNYTKTVATTDTMRTFTPIARFDHSLATRPMGYEYIISGEVPVSRTLSPVNWKDAPEFETRLFNAYFPQGFDKEFTETVVDMLTKDSTYYNALRTVYINHPFTNAQFAEVNARYGLDLPQAFDENDPGKAQSDKSDAWFSTTTPSDKDLTGYYYTTLQGEQTICHEIATGDATKGDDGAMYYGQNRVYPVYKSSPWVFCRYDDNTGSIISTVRAPYMQAFKDLLAQITFPQWIYSSTDKVYRVDFSRKYSLSAQFRVYDTNGQEGIAADVREISIN